MTFNAMGKIFLVLGLGVAGIMATIYITGYIKSGTADFRGEVGKKERVLADPDYRIAAYEEFYNLCGAIQAKNENISSLESASDSASGEHKEQLEGAILAQQNTKNELVQEYNAKAAQGGTRGQFRASELPYQIDVDEENVSCG